MQSSPGDYIGQGKTYNYTSASGAFTATTNVGGGQVNYVQISYIEPGYTHWW